MSSLCIRMQPCEGRPGISRGAGATLFARGRGAKQHAKTNGRGIARFDLRARKGIVAVTVAGRQLLIRDPLRCTSLLAVRASTAPPKFTG